MWKGGELPLLPPHHQHYPSSCLHNLITICTHTHPITCSKIGFVPSNDNIPICYLTFYCHSFSCPVVNRPTRWSLLLIGFIWSDKEIQQHSNVLHALVISMPVHKLKPESKCNLRKYFIFGSRFKVNKMARALHSSKSPMAPVHSLWHQLLNSQ